MSNKVTLAPSGKQLEVEDNESILDAAIRQGIGLPYGCRNGRCGACIAVLEAGEVSYPEGAPEALEGEPAGKCLPCKAIPMGDVTIIARESGSVADLEVKILPTRVHRVEHLAHDVVRLYLKIPETQRLQFLAGQYIDFLLADGRRRAFSIANAPHDDEFIELHIRHVDGGQFTDWVFNQMKDKSILRIQAPLGNFTLDESSERPLLFIGGGTGFAPLKGQIEHAFEVGIDRPMHLYWGVRSRRDLYLADLPQQWAADHPNFSFVPVFSEPDADWDGRTGFVHEAVVADIDDLAAHDVYMAGPPAMVKAGREALLSAGVPESQIHHDSFEYAEDTRDKAGD